MLEKEGKKSHSISDVNNTHTATDVAR